MGSRVVERFDAARVQPGEDRRPAARRDVHVGHFRRAGRRAERLVYLREIPQPAALLAVVLEPDAIPEGCARTAGGGQEPGQRLVEVPDAVVDVRDVDDAPERVAAVVDARGVHHLLQVALVRVEALLVCRVAEARLPAAAGVHTACAVADDRLVPELLEGAVQRPQRQPEAVGPGLGLLRRAGRQCAAAAGPRRAALEPLDSS